MPSLNELLDLAEKYNHELPAVTGSLETAARRTDRGLDRPYLAQTRRNGRPGQKTLPGSVEYGFASVCVNPVNVPLSAELLSGSKVKVCSVVGFPFGATPPAV